MTVVSATTQELAGQDTHPGARPKGPDAVLLNPGAVLDGRFRIVRAIGQGGMGRVLEVIRLDDRRTLALKYATGRALGRRRLVREARILGTLRHPHLVPVLDANLDHDPPYFVMPLALGTLETERVRRVGDLSWALRVFRQVALGVHELHRAGVVHRDLKPANVLRMRDGRHVVADLGTAKREPRDSTVLTRTCAILGTLSYLAPEQLMPGGTRQADARTDIYQLGKLLYQLVTGRSPAVVEPDRLPSGLARIVRRATALRPDDRYRKVADLLEAIELSTESAGDGGTGFGPRTFSQVLEELDRILARGGQTDRDAEEVLDVLECLDRLPAPEALDVFDRLPVPVLAALGRHSGGRLVERLRAYARCLERACARRGFPYADLVAGRMQALAAACPAPEVLACAVEAVLIVAVALNRYAAMSVFKQLLYRIRDVESALAVAERLRDRRDDFQEIAPFLLPARLHPILRRVINTLEWVETVTF